MAGHRLATTYVAETKNLPIKPFELKDSLSMGKDWEFWLEEIERQFRFFRIESPADKKDALMIFGGREIVHLGKYLPDPDTEEVQLDEYQKLRVKLNDYFIPKRNKYLARYLFLKMRPKPCERTAAYVTRLREKASDCEFGDNFDERILEHLIITMTNERIKEKCIRKKWTLSELLRNIDEEEIIALQVSCMGQMPCGKLRAWKEMQIYNQNCKAPENILKRCGYCGLSGIHIKGRGCPAYGKKCFKCNKRDHFAAACRTKAMHREYKHMPPFIKHVTRHRNKTVMEAKSDFCFKDTAVGRISATKHKSYLGQKGCKLPSCQLENEQSARLPDVEAGNQRNL